MIRHLLSLVMLVLFPRRSPASMSRDDERFAIAQLNWRMEHEERHQPGPWM